MITGRGNHGCGQFLQNGQLHLIVAGGSTDSGNKLKSVEILSSRPPKKNTFEFWSWESMGHLAEPRTFFPTVAVLDNQLVIAGKTGVYNNLIFNIY